MYIALYARQSIDRDNSVSIETQLEYCKASLRPDEQQYETRCFSDKGYSGKNTDRPEFRQLMRDVCRGNVHKIIVYKLDRISRSIVDFVDMLREFKEHNVSFASSQEGFDTSSAYGEMICKILMVFAEFERESIVNRVKDAYEKRSDMGLYTGGRRIYGFELREAVIHGIKTKQLFPKKDEAEQVKQIFSLYSQPAVTLRMVQNKLLADNILPLNGSEWSTGKLSAMLRNPVYAMADADIYSYFESRGTHIVGDMNDFNGKHNVKLYGKKRHDKLSNDWSDMKIVLLESEGIIEPSIWLKCQEKLEHNRQIGNSASNGTSWLAGKLRCDKCGHTMTTVKGGSRRYFMCTGRTHKKTCTGLDYAVYVSDMEKMMSICIAEKLKTIKGKRKSCEDNISSQLNCLKLKLRAAEQKIDIIAETILSEKASPELIAVMNEKAAGLTAEKQKYITAIRDINVNRHPDDEIDDLSAKWENTSFREKREVCDILVKAVNMTEYGDIEVIWNI
ncbi:MAG: recombinase family protein [Ruminococcus sp.]|nr:recombinase family protein [Ruminococcus sp.]